MRIVVLHSPYLTGPSSGENRVVEDEVRLLREAGHEVTLYLPERVDPTGFARAREGVSAVWSRAAVEELRRLLEEQRPEIAHCHNLFPALSPAVIREAARRTAVVMTLHNYRLLCLPATLLRDGAVCEDCLGRLPWRGVAHRCYRGSLPASAALGASIALHRALGTFDSVSLYLAVTRFMRDKHVEGGLPSEQVIVKQSFVWPAERRDGPGDAFVFLGRLSAEKGIGTLADAWRDLPARLVVAGDGPEMPVLRTLGSPNVELLGSISGDEAARLLSRARALVLPSVWYEGAPRSILEAYAAGVPVIAASIGGLSELVVHGESGLLVPPRDPQSLAAAVRRLQDDAESERMGAKALQLWNTVYAPQRGLAELERAYALALERRRG